MNLSTEKTPQQKLSNFSVENVTAINNKRYQDIYTSETIQIVADWYKDDIDQWGFDFDTSAQKNYWSE